MATIKSAFLATDAFNGTGKTAEFKTVIRQALKAPKATLSDGDIDAYVTALDIDCKGIYYFAELFPLLGDTPTAYRDLTFEGIWTGGIIC